MRMNSPIEKLQRFTTVTPETSGFPDASQMLSAIHDAELSFSRTPALSLANAIGNAIVCYTAWYVRGDDRKSFLERAAHYFRTSGNRAALGRLLVEEPLVRDLNEAIPLLEELYSGSTRYEPSLCFYIDALYKDGQFLRSYEAALHVHAMAAREFTSTPASIPTMPMTMAAKALRGEIRRLKRAGQHEEAASTLERLNKLDDQAGS